jgi:hypothetical protein
MKYKHNYRNYLELQDVFIKAKLDVLGVPLKISYPVSPQIIAKE